MKQQLLSFIQIDQRSKTSIEDQFIQQIKDYVHQHFFDLETTFIDKDTFIRTFNTNEKVFEKVIFELHKFQYIFKMNDTYYFTQTQALKYILPKPFGRRSYITSKNQELKEVVLVREIIPTPKHLMSVFNNETRVLKLEKQFFSLESLKATATIYIHPSYWDLPDISIEDFDEYKRNVSLDTKNKHLEKLFQLDDMIFIKGIYQINRHHKCIEYGEVVTFAEYSFKRKYQIENNIVDY